MDPNMVKEIIDWWVPWSVIEEMIFHGLAIFYKNSVRNFSCIYVSLTTCMVKGEFEWNAAPQRELVKLKKKVTKREVFPLLYFENVFQVYFDASGMTIWVVLSQEGKWKVKLG